MAVADPVPSRRDRVDEVVLAVGLLTIQLVAMVSALDHLGHAEPRVGLFRVMLAVSAGAGLLLLAGFVRATKRQVPSYVGLALSITYGILIGWWWQRDLAVGIAVDLDSFLLPITMLTLIVLVVAIWVVVPLLVSLLWAGVRRLFRRDGSLPRSTWVVVPATVLTTGSLVMAAGLALFEEHRVEEVAVHYEPSPAPGVVLVMVALFLARSLRRRCL